MSSPESVLGIVAGRGQFPFLVAQGAKAKGQPCVAIGFEKNTSMELADFVQNFTILKLGQLNKLISFFKKAGVQDIVFAGGIDKPKALDLRPDLRTVKLAMKLKSKNDSSLLQAVARELTDEGFTIISPFEYVPQLMMPRGVLTKRSPGPEETEDIKFGWNVAKELGRLDIGQCAVFYNQMTVAVEAMEGTNSTIKRAGTLVKKGGTVIKIFKPGQNECIDQPAIGLETLQVMAEAGLTCLVAEAGKGLFFDREESVRFADKTRISIVGVEDGQW